MSLPLPPDCLVCSTVDSVASLEWEKVGRLVFTWEGLPPSDCPVGLSVGHFHNCWRRAQPTVGGAVPRQVGLSCVRKVAEPARRSQPASRVPSRFPPWFATGDCNL